jgi:hypothetical protein
MPHQIDPDEGFVEFAFGGGQPPAAVDAYYAHELFQSVYGGYLKRLEEEGRREDADMDEVMTRWAVKLFKKFPRLDPAAWSYSAKCDVFAKISEVIAEAKKAEPGSSTPA